MGIGILILLIVALASGPKRSGSDAPTPEVSGRGLDLVRELGTRGGMTREQIDFLSFVAYGESGLQPDRGLGIPSMFPPGTRPNTRASASLQQAEARAARVAYERNTGWLNSCGHPASHYEFGSGGLFAFLPTYALAQFKGTELACASPYEVFDPAFALAAAYGFARGLQQRSGYMGTVASLRSGWGWPAGMDDMERIGKKSPKWRRHLRAIGLPESWLMERAPDFPRRDLSAMYRAMKGGPSS